MPILALFLAAVAAAPAATAPDTAVSASDPGVPAAPTAPPENLLRGPARCVLRYLDAVRLAGPRAPQVRHAVGIPAREADYAAAKRLVAPRALEEIAHRSSHGEMHPLAAWVDAARGIVLESFQLLAVRRAPRGAAVVTVRERWWRPGAEEALARSTSELLVARVDGGWRVVDRRPGGSFDDRDIADGYSGWFDPPPGAALGPARETPSQDEPDAPLDVAPTGWGMATPPPAAPPPASAPAPAPPAAHPSD